MLTPQGPRSPRPRSCLNALRLQDASSKMVRAFQLNWENTSLSTAMIDPNSPKSQKDFSVLDTLIPRFIGSLLPIDRANVPPLNYQLIINTLASAADIQLHLPLASDRISSRVRTLNAAKAILDLIDTWGHLPEMEFLDPMIAVTRICWRNLSYLNLTWLVDHLDAHCSNLHWWKCTPTIWRPPCWLAIHAAASPCVLQACNECHEFPSFSLDELRLLPFMPACFHRILPCSSSIRSGKASVGQSYGWIRTLIQIKLLYRGVRFETYIQSFIATSEWETVFTTYCTIYSTTINVIIMMIANGTA